MLLLLLFFSRISPAAGGLIMCGRIKKAKVIRITGQSESIDRKFFLHVSMQ